MADLNSDAPLPWRPFLQLDEVTSEACRLLASRFIGRDTATGLCRSVRQMIEAHFPGPRITVRNKTRARDRADKILRLLVSVDGKPDFAMIFGEAKAP